MSTPVSASTNRRVTLTLFKSIMREAKSLARDERKITTALRNGTARVTSESIGASAFQNGIQNLDRAGVLTEAIKARFRGTTPDMEEIRTGLAPIQVVGGPPEWDRPECKSSSSDSSSDSFSSDSAGLLATDGIDEAFQIVHRLNTINGALGCLEESGAFSQLARDAAAAAAAADTAAATDTTDAASSLQQQRQQHQQLHTTPQHQPPSPPSSQQQQQQSSSVLPEYSIGEFVHHWCHGPGLVFGWERGDNGIQTVCGDCADRMGLDFINQLKYFEHVESGDAAGKMTTEGAMHNDDFDDRFRHHKSLAQRQGSRASASNSSSNSSSSSSSSSSLVQPRHSYHYRLLLPGGATTFVPEKSLTTVSWDVQSRTVGGSGGGDKHDNAASGEQQQDPSWWKAMDYVRQLYASMQPLGSYYFKGLATDFSVSECGSYKQCAVPRKELLWRYPQDCLPRGSGANGLHHHEAERAGQRYFKSASV